jgi:hypothetical protein
VQHVHTITGISPLQSEISEVRIPSSPRVARRLQTSSGIVPPIDVSCKVKAERLKYSPTAAGTVPVKRLLLNCSHAMSGKFPMPLILPLRKLLLTSNCVKELRLSNSVERVPVRTLKSRSKTLRFVKRPISVGIVDVRPPRCIPKNVKSVKRPISRGIVPTRLLDSVEMQKGKTSELVALWVARAKFPSYSKSSTYQSQFQ